MRLNPSAIIPLIALACYSVLLAIVARRPGKTSTHRFFLVYLVSMIVWSFASFMMLEDFGFLDTLFWNRVMVIGSTAMPIAFFGFVQAFLGKPSRFWLAVGVVLYLLTQAANVTGFLIREASLENGLLRNEYGPVLSAISATWVFFIGFASYSLIRDMRVARDSSYKNRLRYLLIVIILMLVGSLTNATSLSVYPVDIGFNAVCAVLIAYAILRHHMLEITVVVRKGLLYSFPTILTGAAYFTVIYLATTLLHVVSGAQITVLSLVVAVMAALVAQPFRDKAQQWIDRLFFREKYDVALMLQRLSTAAASILDLSHLTELILREVADAMHIRQAAFFLRRAGTLEFSMFAWKGEGSRPDIRLRRDHVIVEWLTERTAPLSRHDVDIQPRFKALWMQEREDLGRLGAELFVPVRAQANLVGILVVGPKRSEETYSEDEQRTLTTLANQMAVTVENARLYWELQRAHEELEQRVDERTAELAEANRALQTEVAERIRAEEQTKASLREKEVLLKEVHHRVKNNLQVISSLLYLQSTNVTGDRSMQLAFQDSRNRVRSMALVHEKLYQSKDLAKIGFAEYLRSLVSSLMQSYDSHPGRVNLVLEVGDTHFGVDTAVPCGLLINELVSNSLKYAFTDNREGTISIEITALGEERYILLVNDDGVGLPPGLDFQNTASLGLTLVNTLVQQLEGKISLDRCKGGTHYRIEFQGLDRM